MSNNFDTAVILDSSTYVGGDTGVSGTGYFGFDRVANQEYTSGPRILSGSGVPGDSAPMGSLYLRSGVGQLYINTSGSTTWTLAGAVYPAGADGTAVDCPILRKTYSAGTANTSLAVPERTGGWRITDVYIINGGAGSGAVQLQTSGGALNITDAMTSSASGNGFITRAASILNNTVASGATLRIAATSPASAGEMFITLEPA